MILNEVELDRFMSSACPEPNSGCWLWMKATPKNGYAQFKIQGVQATAHAVSYWNFKGPVQPGFMVHHKCRVRCCVNPDHLDAVSPVAHRSAHAGQRVRPFRPERNPTHPKDSRELLTLLGGPTRVAKAVGRKTGAVQAWSRRNSIPTWEIENLKRVAVGFGYDFVDASFILRIQ